MSYCVCPVCGNESEFEIEVLDVAVYNAETGYMRAKGDPEIYNEGCWYCKKCRHYAPMTAFIKDSSFSTKVGMSQEMVELWNSLPDNIL
jgi:formate hydrogenlyase subunit 6/NADH:ubiquinone oxidoreductase subunit I